MKRCRDNKNPEALYREGVVQFFGRSRLEIAIKCLEEATNSGHMGAYYAMAVIYLLSGDELKKQKGIRIVGEIIKSNGARIKLMDYRANLILILRTIWKNLLVYNRRPVCCTMMQQHKLKQKKTGWLSDDEIIGGEDKDGNICEACASDFEIQLIRSVL